MISYLKTKFFKDWFPHWSPEIALRYLPIAYMIKRDISIHSILDVGSGSLGITPYLKRNVVGIDINFNGPYSPYLKRIKGFANSLPFKNKTFDATICADTLEHIKKKYRKKVITELIRVTKKKIFITIPVGSFSEKEDIRLYKHLLKTKKWDDPYLKEHIAIGLPKEKDIMLAIPSNFSVKIKNLTNIYLRRIILKAQFSNQFIGRFISSVIFVLLLPIFLNINKEPTYRKLYIITIDN